MESHDTNYMDIVSKCFCYCFKISEIHSAGVVRQIQDPQQRNMKLESWTEHEVESSWIEHEVGVLKKWTWS